MARLVCPYCGRNLPTPAQIGTVTCDGCEESFDPAQVRLRPVLMPKRVIGWALLVVGSLLLVSAVSVALRSDFRDRDIAMKLVGTFLVPAVAIFAGLALKSGKVTVDDASPPSESKLGAAFYHPAEVKPRD